MGRQSRLKQERRRAKAAFLNSLQVPPERLAGAFLDSASQRLCLVTKDVLTNQLRRDAPRIAASFDALCGDDLAFLSEFFSRTVGALMAGIAKHASDPLRMNLGMLLMNACNSFLAAVHLLREGFLLQPGILIRSLLEQVSTAIHLMFTPSDLKRLESGEFDSTRTIASAKRAIPMFGQMYGQFSKSFTHISQLHVGLQPVTEFKERNPAVLGNLSNLGLAVFVLSIAAELVFFDSTESPMFWRRLGAGQYSLELSPEATAFLEGMQRRTGEQIPPGSTAPTDTKS